MRCCSLDKAFYDNFSAWWPEQAAN